MIFAFLDPGTETINFGTRSKVGIVSVMAIQSMRVAHFADLVLLLNQQLRSTRRYSEH
jgi:hypothetical protein